MGEVGKGHVNDFSSPTGLQRWQWKNVEFKQLPSSTLLNEWFFGNNANPPAGVAIGLQCLDKLALQLVPADDVLARITSSKPAGQRWPEIMTFGLDGENNAARLRRAVAQAWRDAETYAEAYLDRYEAERRPFEIATDVRQRVPRAIKTIGDLEAILMPAITSVDRWKYGKRAGALSDEVKGLLQALRGHANAAAAFVNDQVDGEDLDVDEDSSMVLADMDAAILNASSVGWLKSLKDVPAGSSDWIDVAETAVTILEEQVSHLSKLAKPSLVDLRKLRGRQRQIEIILAAISSVNEHISMPEGRASRPDLFLWLRLAEIYTVSFGRRAPLHGTDRPNTAKPQHTPQEQFNDFLKVALNCFNWPNVEMTVESTGLLRHVKEQNGGKSVTKILKALSRNGDISAAQLPSNVLLTELQN